MVSAGMAGRNTKLTPALQAKVVKVLKTGVTVADACQYAGIHVDTFYDWLKRGADGETPFSEFSDVVTRARVDAKVVAIGTLRSAMSPTLSRTKKIHTVTEVRENIYGKPYEYKHVDEYETIIDLPGDWRASVEYLKRRAPDEWSEKHILELNLPPDLLKRFAEAADAAGITAGDALEAFVQELANAHTPADSTERSAEGRSEGTSV